MNGTVDLSAGGLYSAVVFLQYYDGVTIPVPPYRRPDNHGQHLRDRHWMITATPRTIRTAYRIRQSRPMPMGTTASSRRSATPRSLYSYGTLDNLTQMATVLTTKTYQISYAQAMGATGASGASAGTTLNGNITITAASLPARCTGTGTGTRSSPPGPTS